MGKILNINEVNLNRHQYLMFIAVPLKINDKAPQYAFVYVTECEKSVVNENKPINVHSIQQTIHDTCIIPQNIKTYAGKVRIMALNTNSMVIDNNTYIILDKENEFDYAYQIKKYISFDLGTTLKLIFKTYYNIYRNDNVLSEQLIKEYENIKNILTTTFKE